MPGPERTFGIKYDSYTRIKLFIKANIVTYYHHFHYHVLTFISILNLLYTPEKEKEEV